MYNNYFHFPQIIFLQQSLIFEIHALLQRDVSTRWFYDFEYWLNPRIGLIYTRSN